MNWSKTVTLSQELFDLLDVCGTHKPLLCVDTPATKQISEKDDKSATLYVALSDPTNLGALIRTCAAFNWDQIVLLKNGIAYSQGHPKDVLTKTNLESAFDCAMRVIDSAENNHLQITPILA